MILQLAKTTPYLTGQCKLDIELVMHNGVIRTGDCHLSPLSDNLGETDSSDVPFFNCSLADHIKRLRNRLGENFFADSPSMYGDKILYNDEWKDTYDHTYQAGVSRMRYEKYGKQFQLLCPVWTDTVDELLGAKFTFKVRGYNTDTHTCETDLQFSTDLKNMLVEYMKGMNSDLLNINLDRNEVTIKGLEAESGTVITKEVSYYLDQMLDRERPVIETDSMLCQLLPSNGMIARQLINLNFCFNMSDIMSPYIVDETQLKRWIVWVDMKNIKPEYQQQSAVKITSSAYEDTPYVDLYTNYWEIPSYVTDSANGFFDNSRNSLDYLEDHHCIDYIMENKVTQPTFHWALVENPNYMFNFYNGFSPVIRGDDQDALAEGLFFNQPNPYQQEYKEGTNTLNWCNIFDLRGSSDTLQRIQNMTDYENDYTVFRSAVNSIFWKNGMKFDFGETIYPDIHINIIYADEQVISGLAGGGYEPQKPYLYCHSVNPYVVSILLDPSYPTALNSCTLWNILNQPNLASTFNSDAFTGGLQFSTISFLGEVSGFFSNYVYPWRIEFNKSLYAQKVDGPVSNSKEIRYFKSDINHSSHVFRYTGSLRPMMIEAGNDNYYNMDFFYKTMNPDYLKTAEGKGYNEKLKTGYAQEYPSVGYFPLDSVKAVYTPDPNRYPVEYEVKWGKESRFYSLPETVNLEFTISANSTITEDVIYGKLAQEMYSRFSATYPPNSSEPQNFGSVWVSQLQKLYKYKANYDYFSETDIHSLKFAVTYNLI